MSFLSSSNAVGSAGIAPTSSLFKRRRLRVDWRAIAAIDLDKVTRNLDVKLLQDNVINVAFCDLEQENISVDFNFMKVFRLAQLIIEYVLHCQKQMESELKSTSQKLEKSIQVENELRQVVTSHKQELISVKKENRKRRKMLQAAQSLMQAGASGCHKCSLCSKAFVSDTFLQSHMQRRHGEQISLTLADGLVQQQSDRLRQAVDTAREEALQTAKAEAQSELQSVVQNMRKQMLALEERLKAEMKENEDAMLQRRELELAEWAKREEEQKKVELDALHQKIAILEEERQEAQKEIEELRTSQVKKSHLGELEDDFDDGEMSRSRKQAEEIERHQQQIEEANEALDAVKKEMKRKEKKWRKQLKEIETSHMTEMDRVSNRMADMQLTLEETKQQKDSSYVEQVAASSNADQVTALRKQVKQLNEIVSEQKQKVDLLENSRPVSVVTEREFVVANRNRNVTDAAKPVTKARPVEDPDESTEEESADDDDLDVSSFAGSASRDLAESIKRSRQESQLQASAPKTVVAKFDEEEDEEEETETESDKDRAPSSVFEAKPVLHSSVQTRYRHSEEVLAHKKNELARELDSKLEKRGIPSEAFCLSTPQYSDKMVALEKEREVLAKKHRNVFEIRRNFLKEVNDLVKAEFKTDSNSAPSGAGKPPITPKVATATAYPKASSRSPARARPQPFLPKPIITQQANAAANPKAVENDWDNSTEESESELESLPEGPRRTNPVITINNRKPNGEAPKVPHPYTSTPAASASELVGRKQEEKEAENSWDSEGSTLSDSEPEEDLNLVSAIKKRTVVSQVAQEKKAEESKSGLSKDSGRVAALSNRLSASLSMSPDPNKKPKGGVSLFAAPALAFQGNTRNDFDDDDDEEFSSVTEMDDDDNLAKRSSGAMKFSSGRLGSRPPVMVPSSAVNNDFSDLDDDDIETTTLPF